jgi:hypothetical protein
MLENFLDWACSLGLKFFRPDGFPLRDNQHLLIFIKCRVYLQFLHLVSCPCRLMLFRRRHELLFCKRLFSGSPRTTLFDKSPPLLTPESINGALHQNAKPMVESGDLSSTGFLAQAFHQKDVCTRLSKTWLPSGGMTTAEENKGRLVILLMVCSNYRKDEAHSFLIKAGYIRQASPSRFTLFRSPTTNSEQAHSGIYHNLTFGLLVQRNISRLIESAMANVGGIAVPPSHLNSLTCFRGLFSIVVLCHFRGPLETKRPHRAFSGKR